ncbi:hypothetical protein AAFN75_02550 [Algibacter sp. AS12]|uniref:hypothetical protein n=1 Tax=Algibacter sp. AS12 TaxID=3135773 RepID=UPI00398B488A
MTSESLKVRLLNSGDYFTGGKEELPYFHGKGDSKYIKFHKTTGVNATFDFKTDSEFLSIIHEIQNNAIFKYKFCTDPNENIAYNYETFGGNKIRFNYGEMRISLEFPSKLNTFLESNTEFTSVFVCISDDAYAYHTNLKCNGLGNCEAEISKIDIKRAKKNNYKICEICTDDSYSKSRISETFNKLYAENKEKSEPHSNNKIVEEEKNFYEVMGYPKVSFNKNVRAFTVTIKNKKNGVIGKEKMNEPNINNPHFISLKSNNNPGILIVKNKNYKDIVINFTKVYQGEYKDGSTPYYFVTENENYSIGYIEVVGSNDFLTVELNQDSENGMSINYTISEI